MKKYFCRIISNDFSAETEAKIIHFCRDVLADFGAENVSFGQMRSYYKIEGCGETAFTFFAEEKSELEIQKKFASVWQYNVADARRSEIFCPNTNFIWLEADS